jgi:hypothetical protein
MVGGRPNGELRIPGSFTLLDDKRYGGPSCPLQCPDEKRRGGEPIGVEVADDQESTISIKSAESISERLMSR